MDRISLLNAAWPRAFWFSYVAFGLFEIWVWLRDRRTPSGEDADRGSLRAVVAVIAAGIFVAFYAANAFDFARLTPVEARGAAGGPGLDSPSAWAWEAGFRSWRYSWPA